MGGPNNHTRYAIDSKTNRHVRSDVLASGLARGMVFECPCCGKSLGFVAHRVTPHFRHKAYESCIEDKNDIERIHRECESVIKNKMSSFHKDWQSIFPSDIQEVRIKNKKNGSTHIADIVICKEDESKNHTKINFVDDKNCQLLKAQTKKLFIEIQHSSLSQHQVEKRESCYREKESSSDESVSDLLWIIDISETGYTQSNIDTLDMSYTKFAFTSKHSIALSNIIASYESRSEIDRPNILLDPGGKLLYFLHIIPRQNVEFVKTSPISKSKFFEQLKEYVPLVESNLECVSKPFVNKSASHIYSNNYRHAIEKIPSMSMERKMIINDLCNVLESVPLPIIREYHFLISVYEKEYEFEHEYYQTCIEMLICWMGIISARDKNISDCMQKWLQHIRSTSPCYKIPMFGDNVPLHRVSIDYLSKSKKSFKSSIIRLISELESIEHCQSFFNNSNMLLHFQGMMSLYSNNYAQKSFKWKEYDVLLSARNLIMRSCVYFPKTFIKQGDTWNITEKELKVLNRSTWLREHVYGSIENFIELTKCVTEGYEEINKQNKIAQIKRQEAEEEELIKRRKAEEEEAIKRRKAEEEELTRKKEEYIKRVEEYREKIRKDAEEKKKEEVHRFMMKTKEEEEKKEEEHRFMIKKKEESRKNREINKKIKEWYREQGGEQKQVQEKEFNRILNMLGRKRIEEEK